MTPPKFIVGCWAQPAAHFPKLASLGINTVFGYEPAGSIFKTDYEKAALDNGLSIVNEPGGALPAESSQPNRLAWSQDDEPDLNRWKDAEPADSANNANLIPGPRYKGWRKPALLAYRYDICKAVAPNMPVFCNFAGPSITVKDYTHGEGHKPYLGDCDWMGFDWHIKNANANRYTLDLVALACDRLREWGGPDKRLLVYIECAQHRYTDNSRAPTPDEMEAMVDTAVAHGATGIIYFTHTFKNGWTPGTFPNGWYGPTAEMEARMKAVNARLNPPVTPEPSPIPTDPAVLQRIDGVEKRQAETEAVIEGIRRAVVAKP